MGIGRTGIMLSALNNSEYYRGLSLARTGQVNIISQNSFWKNECTISGTVDSGDERAFVKVSFDFHKERAVMTSCTCNQKRGALCSHGVALSLVWIEKAGQEVKTALYTDVHLQQLVKIYNQQQLAYYEEKTQQPQSKVRLYPILVSGSNGFSLECKIGIDKMYVVKDLAVFAQNVLQRNEVNYGKQLCFVHHQEAFHEDCHPLLEFIMNETMSSQAERDYLVSGKNRSLPIKDYNADMFFRVVGDSVFMERGGTLHQVPIVEEKLPITLQIRKYTEEGAQLNIPEFYEIIASGKDTYILFREKIYRCTGEYNTQIKPLLEMFSSISGGTNRGYVIRKQDLKAFYTSVLSRVEPHLSVVSDEILPETYRSEPLQVKFYLDMPQNDLLTLRYEGIYGTQAVDLHSAETVPDVAREMPKEQAIVQFLQRHMTPTEDPNIYTIQGDDERIYDFLLEHSAFLETFGEVYVTDALKQTRLRQIPKIRVGVSIQGNLLDLTLDGDGLSSQELYELLQKYRQKKRYYRMRSGAFLKLEEADASEMEKLEHLVEGMGIKEKDFQKGHIQVQRYRAFYLERIMQGAKSLEMQSDEAYKNYLSQTSQLQETAAALPVGLQGELRDYQKKGFHWMNVLQTMGLGGILADEMGLGKTIQVITLILAEKERTQAAQTTQLPSLIVCPASLVYNWLAEIKRFAPSLQAVGVVGDAQERMNILTGETQADIFVTSYDLLRRDIEWYENRTFRFQVIDEAQFIKNQSTKNAQLVKQIAAQAKFALTGTPIENRLSELWSIFDYLMPGYLFSYAHFKREIETPIVREDDDTAYERLQHMIAPFVLRRKKKDVLTELPDKLERVVYAQLEGEQKQLYAATKARLLGQLQETTDEAYRTSKIQILAELTKLRQICCAPGLLYDNYTGNNAKLETCMELLGEAVAAGHKILLFSQFTSMLEMLQKRLVQEAITFVTLTGDTSKEKRQELVTAFQAEDSDISVFLISLKAGGTGLNLTAADVVIHYDPWWNVAAQNQATDRTHRIGQTNVVSVHKLIMDNSIEEKILQLQEAKHKLAEDVLSGEHAELGTLSREALIALLQ